MDPLEEVLRQRVGQTIADRWVLRSLIGAGGMAAVYAAEGPAGQRAALKLLYPEMAVRKDIRERFLREAAVMARIAHPSMVTIYEHGQSGDVAYLAMELLIGETVADRVRRQGKMLAGDVLGILDQVLDVLALAHSMGIVHRDLKPENLFLTQSGRVKVLDFGLARLLEVGADNFRTRTGAALGTLPYMAPEQALGRRDDIDARTDLFAVGATAYRLLAGKRIHDAPSEAELLMCMASKPAQPLLSAAPELAPELGMVVDRALAFAKTSRYPDASTMQSDVRALLQGQPPTYALAQRERDESTTRVDRLAPRVPPATAPGSPNSTKPLDAAPSPADPLPPTAFDSPAGAAETQGMQPPLVAAGPSARVLSPTVAMPESQRNAPTVADLAPASGSERRVELPPLAANAAAQGASIPTAPISDAVLERQRRRTRLIGLFLLLGMLGVTTTVLGYVLLRPTRAGDENARPASPGVSSVPAAVSATTKLEDTDTAGPRPRHPQHVMTPLEEPPPEPGAFPVPRARRRTPGAASGQTPSSSASSHAAQATFTQPAAVAATAGTSPPIPPLPQPPQAAAQAPGPAAPAAVAPANPVGAAAASGPSNASTSKPKKRGHGKH